MLPSNSCVPNSKNCYMRYTSPRILFRRPNMPAKWGFERIVFNKMHDVQKKS